MGSRDAMCQNSNISNIRNIISLHFFKTYKLKIWHSGDSSWRDRTYQVTGDFDSNVVWHHLTIDKSYTSFSTRPINIKLGTVLTQVEGVPIANSHVHSIVASRNFTSKNKSIIPPFLQKTFSSVKLECGAPTYQVTCPLSSWRHVIPHDKMKILYFYSDFRDSHLPSYISLQSGYNLLSRQINNYYYLHFKIYRHWHSSDFDYVVTWCYVKK